MHAVIDACTSDLLARMGHLVGDDVGVGGLGLELAGIPLLADEVELLLSVVLGLDGVLNNGASRSGGAVSARRECKRSKKREEE